MCTPPPPPTISILLLIISRIHLLFHFPLQILRFCENEKVITVATEFLCCCFCHTKSLSSSLSISLPPSLRDSLVSTNYPVIYSTDTRDLNSSSPWTKSPLYCKTISPRPTFHSPRHTFSAFILNGIGSTFNSISIPFSFLLSLRQSFPRTSSSASLGIKKLIRGTSEMETNVNKNRIIHSRRWREVGDEIQRINFSFSWWRRRRLWYDNQPSATNWRTDGSPVLSPRGI